ncbi:MAG: hypothetical protein L0Z50_33640 [Verrucomicrobiales bacterium]|nr:hypothetical protein [Verrucomicrobiales bacterium]
MTDIDYDVIAPASIEAYAAAPDTEKANLYSLLEKAGYSESALEKLGPKPDPIAPKPNPHIEAPREFNDYRIKLNPNAIEGLDVGEIASRYAAIKTAFHSAGVPENLAQGLAGTLQRSSFDIAKAQREEGKDADFVWEQEKEVLQKIYGEERAKSLMIDAGIAVTRLGGLEKISPSGAFSASAVVSLANLTAVLRHRGEVK